MREIIFRGKSKRTKNFVYGHYWINQFTGEHLIKMLCEGGTQFEDVVVIPETVGQFTGLTDKNGTRIFEGDTVQRAIYPPDKDRVIIHDTVSFKFGCFYLEKRNEILGTKPPSTIQLTGNIHDKTKKNGNRDFI